MGGEIIGCGDPDQGSFFRFTLRCPLLALADTKAMESNAFSVSAKRQESQPNQGVAALANLSPRVLLVEDDNENLELQSDFFSEAGLITDVTGGGSPAVIQRRSAWCDAIMTDKNDG